MDESWIEHKGFKNEAEGPDYTPFPAWWYEEHRLEPVDLSTLKSIKCELQENRIRYTSVDASKESQSISPKE